MPARLPSLSLIRLIAALLLATIGLHAAHPFEPSLRPVHGSAFSAATVDVALAPQRRSEPAKLAPAPQPTLFPSAIEPLTGAPERTDRLAPRPDSTGPPAFPLPARLPPPRAPPLP
jgi:hypothetical protein